MQSAGIDALNILGEDWLSCNLLVLMLSTFQKKIGWAAICCVGYPQHFRRRFVELQSAGIDALNISGEGWLSCNLLGWMLSTFQKKVGWAPICWVGCSQHLRRRLVELQSAWLDEHFRRRLVELQSAGFDALNILEEGWLSCNLLVLMLSTFLKKVGWAAICWYWCSQHFRRRLIELQSAVIDALNILEEGWLSCNLLVLMLSTF